MTNGAQSEGEKVANITFEEHRKEMAEFQPYIDMLEGCDTMEETVKNLFELYCLDYTSEEFQQAYYQEMRRHLEWFKENTKIIDEPAQEVVKTIKVAASKYLSYNDQ